MLLKVEDVFMEGEDLLVNDSKASEAIRATMSLPKVMRATL